LLNVSQIEALRTSNPQLYEALKRIAQASLGPNQGWSLDEQVTDGVNFARVSTGAITAGKIDPTKTGVLMKGSVPPMWTGGFTYASTTASITWSWSALTIARADGTTTAVANGSLAVSGLAPGTTYYFYPYWDELALAIVWVGGIASSAGTPADAFTAKTNAAAQQQSLQGRIPLSQGAMIAATTTSGTGGGSGGGSGSCLRVGSMVLTRERGTVEIESCKPGEHLRCPGGTGVVAGGSAGAETWTKIARLEVRDADLFIRLHFSNLETLDVTPHHIFTLADGSPMRAERLCLSDIFMGRFGRITLKKIETIAEDSQKVTVSCEPTHQFFAGKHSAAVLTHNYTFSS